MLSQPTNHALKRPATQSSFSAEWSRAKGVDEDAAGANDGDLSVEYGCHTELEHNPWWQVDLGSETAIQRVVIYNRQECAYRLRYFSLYASQDGWNWERFFKKNDDYVFGRTDDAPFTVEPEQLVLARYVRLQLDCFEILHFKEIEVYGKEVTDADRASLNEKEASAWDHREFLIGDREGSFVKINQQYVFVDTRKYSETIIDALSQGNYEQTQRGLVEALLHPADRVLEAGTGIGVVTMAAAYITGPEHVRSFDAGRSIIADALMNFSANGMTQISAVPGVLKCRASFARPGNLEKFHLRSGFWAPGSGIQDQDEYLVGGMDIPVFCLEDEIEAHKANVLIIDVEGGGIDLLMGAKLSPIRLIILEARYRDGRAKTDALMDYMMTIGFNIDLEYTGAGYAVLRRSGSLMAHFEAKPKTWWQRLLRR